MERSLFDAVAGLDGNQWMFYGKSLFMAPYLMPAGDKAILDAGCGTGPMLDSLKVWGHVTGLDASEYALSLARKHCDGRSVTLRQGDVSRMPFSDGSFDVVTLFDVLYHRGVADDDRVIKESYRVLKEGGVLIITDSAFRFLRTSYDEEAHVARRYLLREMKEKLVSGGFAVKKASYIFFFVFPAVAVMRLFGKNSALPGGEKKRIFSPNPVMNACMRFVMRIEAMLLRHVDLPFGVSLFCVGIKKGAA